MKPAQTEKCLFKSLDGLTLEGEFSRPETPVGTAILCHPHPLYGGSMCNNVVDALFEALPGDHILTMRFNFRGVGLSEGGFEEGIGEVRDVEGAVRFISDMGAHALPCFLIGYSFGAYVLHRLDTPYASVKGVVMISPPVSMIPFDSFRLKGAPTFFIAGDRDLYCHLSELESLTAPMNRGENTLTIIPGADHFWFGKEKGLVENIRVWLRSRLNAISS